MRARLPHLPPRPALAVRRRSRSAPHPRPRPAPSPVSIEDRFREGGGPRDNAFYACSCGYAFNAAVSTSVRCPHCGDGQAW